ncbi:S8 family serine peptidase [Paraburkholderia hospita]|jgi:hypothetical protein|uniref:S8 family serine peptidase n=1 Tax=Paraburkholderia hospita TaxID=169430 RepID=UPI001260146D|nr:S8 family serine peptidase [Paraburkholderia hospita]
MTERSEFSASIVADEIVPAGKAIELSFVAAVDPRSAQAAIRLMRGVKPVDVLVCLKRKGRVVQIPIDPDAIGPHRLVVSELLDTKERRLVGQWVLPFSVVPISGKVESEVRVEHAVRLVMDDLNVRRVMPGETSESGHVDMLKVVHRKTGMPAELAFDAQGNPVDGGELLAALERRRAARFGRIHETLFDRLANARDKERIAVNLWPRVSIPPAPYEKPADFRIDERPDGEQRVARTVRAASGKLRDTLKRMRIEIKRSESAFELVPCVRTTATAAQIRELAKDKSIGGIYLDDTTAVNDLGNSIAVARSDRAHTAGFDGTGIRVAVWESGPSVTTNLSFAGRFTSSPAASDHARLTSAIVKNTETGQPRGHAPDCDLYSANTSSTEALLWAVQDQGCTVVSQSFHRGTEPGGSTLQSDDLLKDWLALRWPYPTIVQAVGNFWLGDPDGISPPESEYVNHKGYNSLALGNHDDTASSISGDSVFRNPVTSHGDRELPELAANGTAVSANGQTMSGTSFAAPAAAGVTALLQDVDGVLCSWPEGCRAILLASAGRNVRDGTWWQDVINRVDGRDGAGAVDAQAGVAIARQRRWRDAPGTRYGWDVGTLSSDLIGADRLATFRYYVSVPRLLWSPTVKVAIAWDSAVTSSGQTATASTLTVDLDLLVRNSAGIQVAASASWDNSYEVVEFAGTRGETYEIVIRRWSGADSVWFGVAWTVSGFVLVRQRFDLPVERLPQAQ